MPKRPPRHPVYKAWWAMKYRCYQEHHPLYKWYGARGIKVCDRWRDSCATFMADMLPTWKQGLSLERKDNELDYSPDNCRWATQAGQARNTTRSRTIRTPFGDEMHVADAADFFGLNRNVLRGRLERDWPEHLLFIPPLPSGVRLTDLL